MGSKKNDLIFCKADSDKDFGLPKSIAQVEKEAREYGLSYGQYVAGTYVHQRDLDIVKKRRKEIAAYNRRMEGFVKASRAGIRAPRSVAEGKPAPAKEKSSGGRPPLRVQQLNSDGEVLATYASVREAAREAKMNPSSIMAACDYYRKRMRATGSGIPTRKTPTGFRWRYVPQEDEE